MHMPWRKSKQAQLNLLDTESEPSTSEQEAASCACATAAPPPTIAIAPAGPGVRGADGRPMFIAVSLLYERFVREAQAMRELLEAKAAQRELPGIARVSQTSPTRSRPGPELSR